MTTEVRRPGTMRAIVFEHFGGPDVLQLREIPIPEPAAGEVRVRVCAIGLNAAEAHMRAGDWGPVAPVTGIECVGEIDADPAELLERGTPVAAVCGGMGRTRNGSYAEYVTLPRANVVVIPRRLPWPTLATLPESYATAWFALERCLALPPAAGVLVRGGTSALGRAAIALARRAGRAVTATTRRPARLAALAALGATAIVDTGVLAGRLGDDVHVSGVLDIVGTSVLRDSLRIPDPGGTVCQLGFLGGFGPLPAFDPLVDIPSGVRLTFFASAFAIGTPAFALGDVPFDGIIADAASGRLNAEPAAVFTFDEVVDAHRYLEAAAGDGKAVLIP